MSFELCLVWGLVWGSVIYVSCCCLSMKNKTTRTGGLFVGRSRVRMNIFGIFSVPVCVAGVN